MANELIDGEFWLPPEFLTDDDLLMDFKNESFKEKSSEFSYGIGNFSGFHSDSGSLVGSTEPETETDSDEDDFVTGLTRKIANSTLQEPTAKGLKLSGSPQSTLHRCGPGSSRGSPNCGSRVSSPPDCKKDLSFDLLYAAAEEVARMRKAEMTNLPFSNQVFNPAKIPGGPLTGPVRNPNPASGFYPNQAQAYYPYQQTQFQQQQMMKGGVFGSGQVGYPFQNGLRNGGERKAPQGLSTAAWPTLQQSQRLQQRPGSGMRAVFLGETGLKKERTGTGVFLPRRVGTPTCHNEIPKKQALCPVLLPDRVVHALNLNLNLNLDSADSSNQSRHNGRLISEHDVALKHKNNVTTTQELRLPQEWTY